MNVTVIIATCGDTKWRALAQERALPSAEAETDHPNRTWVQPHYPHETVAAARNRAVQEHVASDWLCFLDADDELEPGYLDAMGRELLHVWHGDTRIGGPPHPGYAVEPLLVPMLRRYRAASKDGEHGWLVEAEAGIPNKGKWPRVNECVIGTLVHRDMFTSVGGFRDHTDDGTPITMYEDWDLWLRCWNSGAQLVYTEAVYREYVNEQGRNTNAHLSQQVYDAIWHDHGKDREVLGLG